MLSKIAERIKFETELLKLSTIVSLALGGGSVGLLLGEFTPSRLILSGSGLIVSAGLIVALWWQRRYILTLIEQIQESQ